MSSKEHHTGNPTKLEHPEQANENEKTRQLRQFYSPSAHVCPFMAMTFGTCISNTDTSLKAGSRGPLLMQDVHFRDKLTHFDHQEIPQRVVHARGFAAHGYFQAYKPISGLSCAHVFNTTEETPVFVRFSTVLGYRGSADTVRDVRGFATRFYTQEGNWDLVGNNIPVFFIQDAIKFPDIVHAGKPSPNNDIPQAQTAHDNFWDFISLTPESAHMAMWVLSDRAIPRSYRMMNGFGVNTFTLISSEGVRRFVKFHWKPILGVHSLVWDEAQKIQGVDPDFHRRDLWEAIGSGNYPEWELGLQVVDEADEHKFDFDLLDDTKFIPEEIVPIQYVGKMVLNRNVDEFFAETEQVAFCTQNIVPGIDFSDDPMLQGRNFSYLDTQLLRLGTPNFNEIPINRPIVPVVNNQRGGFARQTITPGMLNYWPNRLGIPKPADENQGGKTQLNAADGVPATNAKYPPGNGLIHYPEKINDLVCRLRGPKFQDHFSQATLFYLSLTDIEQQHLLDAIHNEFGHVDDQGVRDRMIHDILNNVDHDLACKAAVLVGVKPPTAPGPHIKKPSILSPGLAIERTEKNSIATRKIAFLISDGFDLVQYTELSAVLTAAGAIVVPVAPYRGSIPSSSATSAGQQSTSVMPQFTFTTSKSVLFDAFVVVGGQSGQTLSKNGSCIYFLREAYKHCKGILAVGEGIQVLEAAALPGVQLATQADGVSVVNSLGVVSAYEYSNTSSESAITGALKKLISKIIGTLKVGAAALAFMDVVRQHRFWDRPIDEVAA